VSSQRSKPCRLVILSKRLSPFRLRWHQNKEFTCPVINCAKTHMLSHCSRCITELCSISRVASTSGRQLKYFFMTAVTAQASFLRFTVLRSENPSGKCANPRTVAASNNRNHMPWSLYHCLFAPHIYGCYSPHTSPSGWIAHSTQRQWRGCINWWVCQVWTKYRDWKYVFAFQLESKSNKASPLHMDIIDNYLNWLCATQKSISKPNLNENMSWLIYSW